MGCWGLLTLSLFAVFSGIAAQARANDNYASENQALTQDLLSQSKVLSRPVVLYHWAHRIEDFRGRQSNALVSWNEEVDLPGSGPVPLNSEHGFQYIESMAKSFFTAGHYEWTVGQALYLAVDPAQSAQVADAPWVIFSILVPRDTRYLELRRFTTSYPDRLNPYGVSGFLALRKSTYLKLVTGPCSGATSKRDVSTYEGDPLVEISKRDLLEGDQTGSCRNVLQSAFRKAGIELIAYAWEPPAIEACIISPANAAIAFILLEVKDRDQVRTFVEPLEKDLSFEKREAYRQIYDLMALGKKASKVDSWKKVLPEQPSGEALLEQYLPWLKTNIFACDADQTEELRILPAAL